MTKGYDYARLFLGPGEKTEIRRLVSEWKVVRGIARPTDAAFVSPKHRIALRGGLNFGQRRFEDFTVAVVDKKGCAELRQTIQGPFENPTVNKPGALSAIVGPLKGIVKQAKDALPFGDCEPFYTGSVPPPTD